MTADADPRDVASIIENHLHHPTARGLAQAVGRAIATRELPVGTRLPTVRYLAVQLGVSPTTITAAWNLLMRSGSIRTEGRRGSFVAEPPPLGPVRYRRALARVQPVGLDLASGVPDPELLPDLSRAVRDLRVAGSSLNYLEEPVLPALADALAASWPFPAADIAIADGAMDAADQVFRSVLSMGERVLVETPTFPALVDQVAATGAEVVGVPIDGQGIVPDALAAALTKPAHAVVLQVRAQNPTGAVMTAERAEALASILEGTNTLVIEDDSAGEISSAPAVSLGQWLPDQTVHIRSFSKSHGPDLRLAAFTAPEAVLNDVRARRQLGQGWSSRILQQILLSLLQDPASQAEVATARSEYARRRRELASALRGHGVEIEDGDGLNMWVPVADETSATLLLATQGIGVAPGSPFTLVETSPHIRVSTGTLHGDLELVAAHLAAAAHAGEGRVVR